MLCIPLYKSKRRLRARKLLAQSPARSGGIRHQTWVHRMPRPPPAWGRACFSMAAPSNPLQREGLRKGVRAHPLVPHRLPHTLLAALTPARQTKAPHNWERVFHASPLMFYGEERCSETKRMAHSVYKVCAVCFISRVFAISITDDAPSGWRCLRNGGAEPLEKY